MGYRQTPSGPAKTQKSQQAQSERPVRGPDRQRRQSQAAQAPPKEAPDRSPRKVPTADTSTPGASESAGAAPKAQLRKTETNKARREMEKRLAIRRVSRPRSTELVKRNGAKKGNVQCIRDFKEIDDRIDREMESPRVQKIERFLKMVPGIEFGRNRVCLKSRIGSKKCTESA
jgi:hypothetical protein